MGSMVFTATLKPGKKASYNTGKTSRPDGGGTNSTIPPTTTLSVTNVGALRLSLSLLLQVSRLTVVSFIKEPLRTELGLAHRKRIRSYGTTNHFIHLGTQLWEKDWQIYDKPRVRVDTWAKIQLYMFTSAKVGKFIESTCRAGSGRGLYYRMSTFRRTR